MLPELDPCSEENSVLEVPLRAEIADGLTVSRFDVMEHRVRKRGVLTTGYYVIVQSPRKSARYIVTRRNRERPRQFFDIGRLDLLLKDIAPDAVMSIHRKAKLPPKK